MSTVNSFLREAFPDWHFIGFYTVKHDNPQMLQIGPYQGAVLATALIPFGKGQCGLCAAEETIMVAEDVATCSNYIPCDDVTRSEIVIPVYSRLRHDEPYDVSKASDEALPKRLIAVLDIDSPILACFDSAADGCQLRRLIDKYFLLK